VHIGMILLAFLALICGRRAASAFAKGDRVVGIGALVTCCLLILLTVALVAELDWLAIALLIVIGVLVLVVFASTVSSTVSLCVRLTTLLVVINVSDCWLTRRNIFLSRSGRAVAARFRAGWEGGRDSTKPIPGAATAARTRPARPPCGR
jgi:hypothetical protein